MAAICVRVPASDLEKGGELMSSLMKHKYTVLVYALVVPLFLTLPVLLSVGFCKPTEARKAMEKGGFSEIQIAHTHRFVAPLHGCGRDDLVVYEVRAINPIGKPVSITVCDGLFKHATVRS